MLSLINTSVFVALLVLAAGIDLRTGRIPNKLTGAGLAAAFLLLAPSGPAALGGGAAGAALAFALTFPLFVVRAMGGGDVKLLVVAGAFLGTGRILPALLVTAVAGGVLALAEAARRGVLLPVVFRSKQLAGHWATLGRTGERVTLASPGAVTIPYGVAIAVGGVAAWFL
ncbi:MAG: prepilin peptidase [Gemmatimonadetes bacterium]|nr:prepilin peptidase [Gemmatimonadota bacterium]